MTFNTALKFNFKISQNLNDSNYVNTFEFILNTHIIIQNSHEDSIIYSRRLTELTYTAHDIRENF